MHCPTYIFFSCWDCFFLFEACKNNYTLKSVLTLKSILGVMCWETVAAAAAAGAALPEGKNELPGSLQIPYTTYTQQDFLHNPLQTPLYPTVAASSFHKIHYLAWCHCHFCAHHSLLRWPFSGRYKAVRFLCAVADLPIYNSEIKEIARLYTFREQQRSVGEAAYICYILRFQPWQTLKCYACMTGS